MNARAPQVPLAALALTCLFMPCASADLVEIENQFRVAYDLHVGEKYQAALTDLNEKYLAALAKELEQATQLAQLEDAVRLKEEIARVEKEGPLPQKGAKGELAPVIKRVRESYRKALASLDEDRNQAMVPILQQFSATLKDYQDTLTKEGKLEEALKVKGYREQDLNAVLVQSPAAGKNDVPGPRLTKAMVVGEWKWASSSGRNGRWEFREDGTATFRAPGATNACEWMIEDASWVVASRVKKPDEKFRYQLDPATGNLTGRDPQNRRHTLTRVE